MAAESEDEAAMAYIREQWVGEQMTQRMDEFTVEQRVSVFAGTWNVNGKKAENAGASLAPWLFLWSAGAAAGVAPACDDAAPRELPDVYALGFQARSESDRRARDAPDPLWRAASCALALVTARAGLSLL